MSNNLQYRRTHKAIIGAFLKLSEQRAFDQITVQDIMDEALVSRYTFYKHFKDKYEIAELLQDQLMEEFCTLMDRVQRESHTGKLDQMAQNELWCQFAGSHQEFRALWNIHTDTVDLQERFRDFFRKSYLQQMGGGDETQYRQLEADICAAVQTTLMTFFSKDLNMNTHTLGEPIREVLINACMYLARIESGEQIKAMLSTK